MFSLIYLLTFRISVVGVGIICIVLGYKLFTMDGNTNANITSGTQIDAQIGITKLTLKRVAPGSCFSLFGIILISIMVIQSSPEVILRQVKQGAISIDSLDEIVLKGVHKESESLIIDSALMQLSMGDTIRTIEILKKISETAGQAMNALAWLYFQKGEFEMALPLSKAAVDLKPENADYLHTLASVYFGRKDTLSYRQYMSAAAQLNPKKYGNIECPR